MKYQLRQRGRASLDYAAKIGGQIGGLARPMAEALQNAGLSEETLAEDLDRRDSQVLEVAQTIPGFRASNLIREWYCDQAGRIAIDAFDEMGDQTGADLQTMAVGSTTLEANRGFEPPAWWTDHWIHRTHGGWDGHPYMGFIHGELVHGYLVAQVSSGDINAQRRKLADSLADVGEGHILEVGCGSGQFTRVLAAKFPDAEIIGCDLSIRQLEQAQRTLNEMGAAVKLLRCSGEETGLEPSSIDLVVSYALLHEIPINVTKGIFRESFRVLKPGCPAVFGDVPPYSELSKYMQWRADYAARHEGEPFWRESATLDVQALLETIGFVDVERFGMVEGPYPFPYVTRARKPL